MNRDRCVFLFAFLILYGCFVGTISTTYDYSNSEHLHRAQAVFTYASDNMALYFDGSADEVIVPSHSSLNPTSEITMMAWINADNWDGNRRIMQKGVDDQYRLIDEGDLEIGLAGVTATDPHTPLPATGEWHHVAGTYNGSWICLYVDGEEKDAVPASGSIQTSSTALYIGNKPGSVGTYDRFKGLIDEVRIYNKGLTCQEVIETMDNTNPTTEGLVLYYSFDFLDGSTCIDLSGNGNNGTNYGAVQMTSFDWENNSSEAKKPTIPHFTNLPASTNSSFFDVQWNESTSDGYGISYYRIQHDSFDDFPAPVTVQVGNNHWGVSELVNGSHYFRVKAIDMRGIESNWSVVGVLSVEIPATVSYPTTPEFIDLDDIITTDSYNVTWTESLVEDSAIDYYELEMSISSNFEDAFLFTTINTFYIIDSLSNETFYLRVRAIDERNYRSNWSEVGIINVQIPAAQIMVPPVPIFESHFLGTRERNFLLSWKIQQDYSDEDLEYELQMSTSDDFANPLSMTTNQRSYSIFFDNEDWYYFRVHTKNGTLFSEWSNFTQVAYLVQPIVINGDEDVTKLETSNSSIIWSIESEFRYNYSIFVNDELYVTELSSSENITFSTLSLGVGIYNIKLIIYDLAGYQYESLVQLHIVQSPPSPLFILVGGSVAGVFIIFIVVAVFLKRQFSKWKESVRELIMQKGFLTIESLVTLVGVDEPKLISYLEAVDYGILSSDKSVVYYTRWVLEDIINQHKENGPVIIAEYSKKKNIEREALFLLAKQFPGTLIITDNNMYSREKIVEEIRDDLLSTNSFDSIAFENETEIHPDILQGALKSTNLRFYRNEKGIYGCAEFVTQSLVKQVLETGFMVLSEAIRDLTVPSSDLKTLLAREKEVSFIPSKGLLLSNNFLKSIRTAISKQEEVNIKETAEEFGFSEDQMQSLLQYFFTGRFSPDRKTFINPLRPAQKETTEIPTPTRWIQPSYRSVYLQETPPRGVHTQGPTISQEEGGLASCFQICSCIWFPISIILIIFSPEIGGLAIALGVMLAVFSRLLSQNQQKATHHSKTIYQAGRRLDDGRYVCPYCDNPRSYDEREANDVGAVFCKECKAIFPLEGLSYLPVKSQEEDIEQKPQILEMKTLPNYAYWFSVLGVIGVLSLVTNTFLLYYYRSTIIYVQEIGIISNALRVTDITGSILLAVGLISFRTRYPSKLYIPTILLLVILPFRVFFGQVLFDLIGILYIDSYYLLDLIKFVCIALIIWKSRNSNRFPHLWSKASILFLFWGIADSLLPWLFLGGMYSVALVDLVTIPLIVTSLFGGALISVVFLTEIEIVTKLPDFQIMGKYLSIAGGILFLAGLVSWIVYIPILSDSILGETLGLLALLIGFVFLKDLNRLGSLTGNIVLVIGIILLSLGLLSWVVHIPLFSETLLGEVIGFLLLIVGYSISKSTD